MEQYIPAELLLLRFPFTDEEDIKRRPALVLIDVGDDDVVVARVTTHVTRTRFDVEIKKWREAGLRAHPLYVCTSWLQSKRI
jgi:mRNA interferase MazF